MCTTSFGVFIAEKWLTEICGCGLSQRADHVCEA